MMDRTNIIEELLKDLPNLKQPYDEEMLWIKDEKLLHTIFIMIFNPLLIEMININNELQLIKIFNFLEKMADSLDDYIQNLLVVTVFEDFVNERDIVRKAKLKMKNNTLKMFLEFEKACGYS